MSIKNEFKRILKEVKEEYPFPGYHDGYPQQYFDYYKYIRKYLSSGDNLLDFGAGPVNKTIFPAKLGIICTAVDDLNDDWHSKGDNRKKILLYSTKNNIKFIRSEDKMIEFDQKFKMLVMTDILEHLHNSPKHTLIPLIETLDDNGYLFLTVPNAVNLRKRISVIFGKTNYPDFKYFYWHPNACVGILENMLRMI